MIGQASMADTVKLPSPDAVTTDVDTVQVYQPKHPRLTAAVLTITLGMLGAHRLYLGAKPWVPIFYVVSVGGVFFYSSAARFDCDSLTQRHHTLLQQQQDFNVVEVIT